MNLRERGGFNNYLYFLRVSGNDVGIYAAFCRYHGTIYSYGIYRYDSAALHGESHRVARVISAVHALNHGSAVIYFGNDNS